MLFYVVVYDIPNDKRRKKVSDLLEGYGQRVQYSVFECTLTQAKYDNCARGSRKESSCQKIVFGFIPFLNTL